MREWKRGQRVGVERGQEDGGNSGDSGGCLRKEGAPRARRGGRRRLRGRKRAGAEGEARRTDSRREQRRVDGADGTARTGRAGAARRMEARAAPTGLDFIWKESGPRRSSHTSSSSSELASYRQPW